MKTKITTLFNIKYPVIQGGMVWCSNWKLASSVSNSGGLGLIGAGSMSPEILESQIQKCTLATKLPFGVNLPVFSNYADAQAEVILKNKVKIVFTAAGSPDRFTKLFKNYGITVAHVISNIKFARKAIAAGADALVAEGYEAGGHNGIEENTTFTLIPQICKETNIPVIAAGGIATGKGLVAALSLGAEAVQIGSRFAVAKESSAHDNFKKTVIASKQGDTKVILKKLIPIRLLKNHFYDEINQLENNGASVEKLQSHLGKGRAKKGIYQGDIKDGELVIGQIAGLIDQILPVKEIIEEIMDEAKQTINSLKIL